MHRQGSHQKSEDEILNFQKEVLNRRTGLLYLVDQIGWVLTNPYFFVVLIGIHLLWVILNLGIFPWKPWDPYPFTFLATVASVEAPFLSLLILMYQRRNSSINTLRQETHLQVSLHVEREASMILRLLEEIENKLDIRTREDRRRLDEMEEKLDPKELLDRIRDELARTDRSDPFKSV